MRKLAIILLVCVIHFNAPAQTPQLMNYQAIARNSMGQIVPSQNIGVRFTIQDAAGATIFYQETHSTTTNNFGLFTLSIGGGTVVSGTIATIDWSTGGGKYLKAEIAPQGGSTYTIQGTTQLISVPYALYSEKTRLIAGNAISITNGNTISANYVAGPGITINGNTISSTAGNAWLLSGNAGTTASNFIGTTDNQPINFRTNNIKRLSISGTTSDGLNNLSYILAGEQSSFATNPLQISIWGKDVRGATMPFSINGYVGGMNWTQAGGNNNTLGSLMRFAQWIDAVGPNYQFFDAGIDQQGDFFITEHSSWNTGAILPKKLITITPGDFVGINFNWGEHPTANFHTKGTVRFEGINTNNTFTRILAMDANGNVGSRDVSTIGSNQWVADANGIHNAAGNVGIGINSRNDAPLAIAGTASQNWAMHITSSNTWETAMELRNNSNNYWWGLRVGGTTNTALNEGVGQRNFGIINANTTGTNTTFPILITSDDKVGIGMGAGGTNNQPKSRLHVKSGDVYIENIGSGVIMKSPNGSCWRMTVSDAGTPVFTSIPCP